VCSSDLKSARDRHTQAILPLRGKVLNVQRAQLSKVLENSELQALVKALGTGLGDAYDGTRLRYGRIILMADADVDGGHITTLLLTFFHRFMPQLIADGRLHLAQPPLFQLRKGSDVAYAMSDAEREQLMRTTFKGRTGVEVQRFKGLGEMDAEQLWRTTMDPERRTLLRVTIEDAERTAELFNLLMGNQTDPRREWIVERAHFARNVDI
jgi:DNA gyrase subunit B